MNSNVGLVDLSFDVCTDELLCFHDVLSLILSFPISPTMTFTENGVSRVSIGLRNWLPNGDVISYNFANHARPSSLLPSRMTTEPG